MWSLPPSDSMLHVLSYVALAAQAMTAALAAGRRSMDWVGVCLLGCQDVADRAAAECGYGSDTIRWCGSSTRPTSGSRSSPRS